MKEILNAIGYDGKWWEAVSVYCVKVNDKVFTLEGWDGRKYTSCREIMNPAFGDRGGVYYAFGKAGNEKYELTLVWAESEFYTWVETYDVRRV